MREFQKIERKVFRDLAYSVFEADAQFVLQELEGEFLRWRVGDIAGADLLMAVHEFH